MSFAVIGMGYGDEGKGNAVSNIIHRNSSPVAVVRYCGGANAGHTVHTGGTSHVFHHFGSGTLQKKPTFLTEEFICNPILFNRERAELLDKMKSLPKVYVDQDLKVTTHYDMILNEMREMILRHGSTGVGINETIERHMRFGFQGPFLTDPEKVFLDKLKMIENEWVPIRLAEIGYSRGMDPELDRRADWLASSRIRDAFIYDFESFQKHTRLTSKESFYVDYEDDNLIFESSQGLLLDQDYQEFFPHLTRASVGCKLLAKIEREWDVCIDSITYVTRTYMTRHGNGPFPTENINLQLTENDDPTNVSNPWQGQIRYGHIDGERLRAAICQDLAHFEKSEYEKNVEMAVTHCDARKVLQSDRAAFNFWHDVYSDMSKTDIDILISDYGNFAYGPSSDDWTILSIADWQDGEDEEFDVEDVDEVAF